jgi:hypothetical protein
MGQAVLLERGTQVRVKCASGRTAENVVWEDYGDVVLVCGKRQFERLSNGYVAPMPIGFRRVDVVATTVGAIGTPGASK